MEELTTKSRWLRRVRRGLVSIAALVTLVALFYAEENWRGSHDWGKYQREWEAKGEKFDRQAFVPPPVPDEQNFAMTPFLAPVFDFNPEPLQPGQDRWRDTNGYHRAMDFARELFESGRTVRAERHWPDATKADSDIWLEALGTNSTNRQFASPAEAARELLKAYEKYRPVLDEIQAASQRPYTRFNVNYGTDDPAATLLPHLAMMKRLQQVVMLRTRAELTLGQNDAAYRDLALMLKLSGADKDEPFLISKLVQIAMFRIAERELAKGLDAHLWSDSELAALQKEFEKLDFLAEYGDAMRAERACGNAEVEYILRHRWQFADMFASSSDSSDSNDPTQSLAFRILPFMPSGWYHQNQLFISRIYEEVYLPDVDVANHRVHAAQLENLNQTLDQRLREGFQPEVVVGRILLPAMGNAEKKFAQAQVVADEARVACALERYRLAKGTYPETLAAMEPQFIQNAPVDIFSGQPLKYRRTDDGKFILYSVGWNEKDDGGTVVITEGHKTPEIEKGDWVWPVN
jgi:hypothetical protein